jgi:hypothetical protein
LGIFSIVPNYDRYFSHLQVIVYPNKRTFFGIAGSQAFFRVDSFRARHGGSRQLPINTEATHSRPSMVFYLAAAKPYSSQAAPITKSLTSRVFCAIFGTYVANTGMQAACF